MIEEYLEDVKLRIADLNKQLKPLVDGTMQIGERRNAGPMVDTTDVWIERLKEYIVTYERILQKYGIKKQEKRD